MIHEKEYENVKLFTLSANPELAEKISKKVGIPLSKVDIKKFADGELNISSVDSIRGCDVFIIQPTSKPANEHLMELFIFIDSLKRASARTINLIMPYYGYSRQDRKAESRQPITAKLIADLLQTSGINRVVCMDLHAAQIQGFFDIPIDNVPAAGILAKHIKDKKLENIVIVSPDHGGATRARFFSKLLGGCPLAIIDKRRPRPNVAEVVNIIGEVKGKTAVIIDDIVDTAGTLVVFVAMPSTKGKFGFHDIVHPINSEMREIVDEACISAYKQALEENKEQTQQEIE